jgi:hypothetical protein
MQTLGGKPSRKEPFETLRRRWKDNIKIDLKEMKRKVLAWTDLA